MSKNSFGIVIGGVMPAILLGLFSLFQKMGAREGVGPEVFLLLGGLVIAAIGGTFAYTSKLGSFTFKGVIWSIISGSCWAIATACVSYALFNYNTPMSKLAPVFNTNTLTTIILSMILFGEWKELSVIKVLSGAILIIIGAVIVSQA